MKTRYKMLGAAVVLAVVFLMIPVAEAGDDYKTAITTATTHSQCACGLKPRAKYAVQCTTDSYVGLSEHGDAGQVASATNVKAAADALYNVPTTGSQVCICALAVGSAGSCKVYLYRNPSE